MGCGSSSMVKTPKSQAPHSKIKYDLAAGEGNVQFHGDKITKKTTIKEARNYDAIINGVDDLTGTL